MPTVEQALAESRRPLTIHQLCAETLLLHEPVAAQIRALSDAGRIDVIPAHGHHATKYALKSIPSGATPEPQPEVGTNTGSDGSGYPLTSPEAVAVARENPEHEAEPPSAECSGGDVEMSKGNVIADISVFGYIVIAAKRKPVRFAKLENAREAAKTAIRAGAQRAEVFAMVRVGMAIKGAEWVES